MHNKTKHNINTSVMSQLTLLLVCSAVILIAGVATENCKAGRSYYDGCNQCNCDDKGTLACTRMACGCETGAVREDKDKSCECINKKWICKPNCSETKDFYDGCNDCRCVEKGSPPACTRKECPACTNGDFQTTDNTNCMCVENRWSCTRELRTEATTDDSKCSKGDRYYDGCNWCTCGGDYYMCTLKSCPCQPGERKTEENYDCECRTKDQWTCVKNDQE